MSLLLSQDTACTLVVPCYNEAERLRAESFSSFLHEQSAVSFLFVNDGSSDGTLARLQTFCAEHPGRAAVLDVQPNGGKGEAVRRGMLHALATTPDGFTGFWDADLATPLDALAEFLTVFAREPQVDVIFGARVRLLGRHVSRKPVRHYAGRVFATAVSLSLGLPIYDTQCGAKLFRPTPLLHTVLAQPFESRWIFDVEILARSLAAWKRHGQNPGDKLYELPLHTWVDVAGSKLRGRDFSRSFTDLLKIRKEYQRLLRTDGAGPQQ